MAGSEPFLNSHRVTHSLSFIHSFTFQSSLLFFLAVLFLSSLSVKKISERVPSRTRSDDDDSEGSLVQTPAKKTPSKSSSKRTPKSNKKEEFGSSLTPGGRRSCRIQTAEKKKKDT
jgi:hypothetical protein